MSDARPISDRAFSSLHARLERVEQKQERMETQMNADDRAIIDRIGALDVRVGKLEVKIALWAGVAAAIPTATAVLLYFLKGG